MDRFTYTIFIEGSAEEVWANLTDPELTRKFWAGRRVTSDWTPGSEVHLFIEDTGGFEVHGRALEVDPPSRLSFTWCVGEAGEAEAATVSFELNPMGGSLRLSLVHEPLAADDPGRQGWAAILSSLKSCIETGRPLSATEMWRDRG